MKIGLLKLLTEASSSKLDSNDQRDASNTMRGHLHFGDNPRPMAEVDNPWPSTIVRIGPVLNVCIPGGHGSITTREEFVKSVAVALGLVGYG